MNAHKCRLHFVVNPLTQIPCKSVQQSVALLHHFYVENICSFLSWYTLSILFSFRAEKQATLSCKFISLRNYSIRHWLSHKLSYFWPTALAQADLAASNMFPFVVEGISKALKRILLFLALTLFGHFYSHANRLSRVAWQSPQLY